MRVVVTLLVAVVAVTVVICVRHHHKLTISKAYTIGDYHLQYVLLTNVSHHDDQDERAPDTTSSSTYIPLSDDNPTPQDTHHVDDVHGD